MRSPISQQTDGAGTPHESSSNSVTPRRRLSSEKSDFLRNRIKHFIKELMKTPKSDTPKDTDLPTTKFSFLVTERFYFKLLLRSSLWHVMAVFALEIEYLCCKLGVRGEVVSV